VEKEEEERRRLLSKQIESRCRMEEKGEGGWKGIGKRVNVNGFGGRGWKIGHFAHNLAGCRIDWDKKGRNGKAHSC
jgi:hypothetical protein